MMKIKRWEDFQHYRFRNPPWIKLHSTLLDDPDWFDLSPDASKLLVNLWLIASRGKNNGELPPMRKLAFQLHMKLKELEELISQLDHWLEQDASTMLAERLQDACPEYRDQRSEDRVQRTETEKKENKKKKSSRAVGAPIPPDWEPDITDIAWAREKGYQGEDLKTQTEMMKNWALSNANRGVARKLDWSKTWRNWVMRSLGNHVKAQQQQQSRTQVAMEELRAKYGNSRPSNGNGDSRLSPEFIHAASTEPHSVREPTHRLVYREADISFEEDG